MSNNGLTVEKQPSANVSKTKQVTEFPNKLVESFTQINNKYNQKLKSLQVAQEEFTLSQDEASAIAGGALNGFYSSETQKIDENFYKKQQKIDEKSQKIKNSFEISDKKLDDGYKKDKRTLDIKAIESGWKNSSIYQNLQTNLENSYNENKQNLKMDLNEKNNNLEFQKSILETEKQNALKNFNISYAQKLSKKIEEITNEFNKQNKTAQNKIAENITNIQNVAKQEKAASLLSYLKNYTKSDARAFLNRNQNFLINELGDVVFRSVADWVNK